ncbi:MAG: hypothetical protein H0X41_09870 [Chitinophagaceae bacterium]|nr:hypothetical protein [Chitinophagaceae bacterium]
MSESLPKSVDIFLTVDPQIINGYFNTHDPAPIYKRQLSHALDTYIATCVEPVKRYTVIFYKLKCSGEIDKQYAEPLMYALRRHFTNKLEIREKEFRKFKRRTWGLLFISLAVVMLCQGFVPYLLDENHRAHSGLSNSLDVFSWVILWRPIDKLIFYWNPHLKDISLLKKLSGAEVIIIDNAK